MLLKKAARILSTSTPSVPVKASFEELRLSLSSLRWRSSSSQLYSSSSASSALYGRGRLRLRHCEIQRTLRHREIQQTLRPWSPSDGRNTPWLCRCRLR
jgi:hypothetical protein